MLKCLADARYKYALRSDTGGTHEHIRSIKKIDRGSRTRARAVSYV